MIFVSVVRYCTYIFVDNINVSEMSPNNSILDGCKTV